MSRKNRSKKSTDFFEKTDKAKIKYNRNKDGYKKHKKRDYKSW
jgi:hypothetical protein